MLQNQMIFISDTFQVRDEYRTDYDGGRGGYGKIIAQKITPNTMERWEIYYIWCEYSVL